MMVNVKNLDVSDELLNPRVLRPPSPPKDPLQDLESPFCGLGNVEEPTWWSLVIFEHLSANGAMIFLRLRKRLGGCNGYHKLKYCK